MGIKKTSTTSYHPMGNACTEIIHINLLNMIGSIKLNTEPDLKTVRHHFSLQIIVHNIKTTELSPFVIMIGRA